MQKFNPMTDGNRIWFGETNGVGGFVIAEVSAAGGEVRPLQVGPDVQAVADIAPDGSELLVWSGSPIIQALGTLPLPAGALHQIGELKGRSPAWAPGGRLIYAVQGEFSLRTIMGQTAANWLRPKAVQKNSDTRRTEANSASLWSMA